MFRKALFDQKTFCVSWELVAGRGFSERQQEELIKNAERAARTKMIHAVGLTDNPGGAPALAAEFVAVEVKRQGIDPLVHIACRDKNRNELESMLWALSRNGVNNLLVVSGDYPTGSPDHPAKPVFDLDPIHVLGLIGRMNEGLEFVNMGRQVTLSPTDFVCGGAVSPFKKMEAELIGQYEKLDKKIAAGARFIITQIGYDARKLHELIIRLTLVGHDIPVLANIFILSYPVARTMNTGAIPGCVVTDKLLGEIEAERSAPDKGRAARVLRAAKQYAAAKGMGCAGAHIGGHGVDCDMIVEVIERGEELSRNWQQYVTEFEYPQAGGYYLFEKDKNGPLNVPAYAPRNKRPSRSLLFLFSRMVHACFFKKKSPLFRLMHRAAKIVDASKVLTRLIAYAENVVKVMLFECRNCGDCALFDVAYLCPMSGCPKEQRNGPCGGSTDGWCEVYPKKELCVWVKAYRRLARGRTVPVFGSDIVPPCNWGLWRTSSWLNYFLGRDHLGCKHNPPHTESH